MFYATEENVMSAKYPSELFSMDIKILDKERDQYLEYFQPKPYGNIKAFLIAQKINMMYKKALIELQGNGEDEINYQFGLESLPSISEGKYCDKLSVYTDKDGNKAVVPPGYTVSKFKDENIIFGKDVGLVIYKIPKEKIEEIDWNDKTIQKEYNQFTWCPVVLLKSNGTIDGKNFNSKFGRRNYQNDIFSKDAFWEDLSYNLYRQQYESVIKYGGFYISSYNISDINQILQRDTDISVYDENNAKRELRSVKGKKPLVNLRYIHAKKYASLLENTDIVKTHLTFGSEYDSVLQWFLDTKARSEDEIIKDSTKWGYISNDYSDKLSPTGKSNKYCTNKVYDFAGNVMEITQEQYAPAQWEDFGALIHTFRGFNYIVEFGEDYTEGIYAVSSREQADFDNDRSILDVGFRAVMLIL